MISDKFDLSSMCVMVNEMKLIFMKENWILKKIL